MIQLINKKIGFSTKNQSTLTRDINELALSVLQIIDLIFGDVQSNGLAITGDLLHQNVRDFLVVLTFVRKY